MGMVNKEDLERSRVIVEPVIEKPLIFATDADISTLLNEMDDEKQPFDRPVQKKDTHLFEIDEPVISVSQKRRSNQTSEFIVEMADKGLAVLFANYAHASESKDFEADPEDIKDLAKYWGVYFQDKSIDMPPWVMALIVTMMVLGKKFNMAKQVRTANLRAEAAEAEAAEVKKEMQKEREKAKEKEK